MFEKKFGQSLLEKIEELLDNIMEFREGDFDEEDDFFFVMKESWIRKELMITNQELIMLYSFLNKLAILLAATTTERVQKMLRA